MKQKKKEINLYKTTVISSELGLVEMIYNKKLYKTEFVAKVKGIVKSLSDITDASGKKIVPLTPTNDILTKNLLRLPSAVVDYGNISKLLVEIKEYISKYVELPEGYLNLVVAYVLTTWLYDKFPVMSYLRVIGTFGSGKTRFLDVVGNVCYKAIFVGGSASLASVFRLIDKFKGTLILDEADYRDSGMSSEITKILNAGYSKDYPVARTEQKESGEFVVKTYDVFCPKILASRAPFEDEALESRCFTGYMMTINKIDKPTLLPKEYSEEALNIRNKLLKFRFDHYDYVFDESQSLDEIKIPRIKQASTPILLVARLAGKEFTQSIIDYLISYEQLFKRRQSESNAAQILICIALLKRDKSYLEKYKGKIKMGDIAEKYTSLFQAEQIGLDNRGSSYSSSHDMPIISAKGVGNIVRKELMLSPIHIGRGFFIPKSNWSQLEALEERYGITEKYLKQYRKDDESEIIVYESLT